MGYTSGYSTGYANNGYGSTYGNSYGNQMGPGYNRQFNPSNNPYYYQQVPSTQSFQPLTATNAGYPYASNNYGSSQVNLKIND